MQLSGGNKVYGIEVNIDSSVNYFFHVVLIEKKKETIVLNSATSYFSWDELWENLEKDIPVAVVLNGRGIVNKNKRDLSEELNTVFPGIDTKDFHNAKIDLKNSSFFQLVRKSLIEEIVSFFTNKKRDVLHLDFGFYTTIETIKVLVENLQEEIIPLDLSFSYSVHENDIIAQGNNSLSEIKISTTSFSGKYIHAYSIGFAYFTGSTSAIQHVGIQNARTVFNQRAKEEKYIIAGLTIILSVLLIATIVSFYAQKELDQITATQGVWADKSSRDSMIVQVKKQKAFLQEGNWMSKSRLAFYADRIAACKIEGIELCGLAINPILNPNEEEKRYLFDDNTIIVKGLVDSENTLNEWLKVIAGKEFVVHSVIQHYNWDSKTGLGLFELKITYK